MVGFNLFIVYRVSTVMLQLRTSLGKALSRNKDDSSTTSSRQTTTSSVGVTHAASLPSIAPCHNHQSVYTDTSLSHSLTLSHSLLPYG